MIDNSLRGVKQIVVVEAPEEAVLVERDDLGMIFDIE